MNETEQRIAIGKQVNWEWHGAKEWPEDPEKPYWRNGKVAYSKLPDYLDDLDACHKMEKKLSLDHRDIYQQWLYRICENGHRMASIYWLAITASASQRCEAFLKTLGLWREASDSTPGAPL